MSEEERQHLTVFSRQELQPFVFRLFLSYLNRCKMRYFKKIFLHPMYTAYKHELGSCCSWTTCRFLGRQDLRFLNKRLHLQKELWTTIKSQNPTIPAKYSRHFHTHILGIFSRKVVCSQGRTESYSLHKQHKSLKSTFKRELFKEHCIP